jgi:hypothetical protein
VPINGLLHDLNQSKDFLRKIKDDLGRFEGKFIKFIQIFFIYKVRSGYIY